MLMSWRTWSYFSSITSAKGFSTCQAGPAPRRYHGRKRDTRTPLLDENKENGKIPPVRRLSAALLFVRPSAKLYTTSGPLAPSSDQVVGVGWQRGSFGREGGRGLCQAGDLRSTGGARRGV